MDLLVDGSTAFWHLAPVLEWLKSEQGYAIEKRLLEVAHLAMQLNLTREIGQVDGALRKELQTVVA